MYKSKTIGAKYYILIFILIATLHSTSQENHFVYMENDNFYLQCEDFYPMAMNYQISIIHDKNGEFHIAPSSAYCWKGPCKKQRMCGTEVSEWHEQIVEHLNKIVELGFNSIRLVGSLATTYDEKKHQLTSSFYRAQNQEDPSCFTTMYDGYKINKKLYDRHGDLLEEFIGIIRENKIPLKIILLTGGGGIENVAKKQAKYLSYLANRFKNEPILFAYDMYNEPSYWCYPANTLMGKQKRIETVSLWYNALKKASPLHLVTIGVYITDVYDWDPQLLPSDLFSLHMYSMNSAAEGWDIVPPFNRSKAQLKCVSETYKKPWIIGENGIWGVDSVFPRPHPIVLTEEEQRWYVENMLKYTNWYGAKGYSWWQFKDSHTYSDTKASTAKSNFHGIVKREDNDQNHKAAGEEFIKFKPNQECEDCFDDDNPNNPFDYKYEMISGQIRDENGKPLKNVFITAQMGGPSYKTYRTYSYIDTLTGNAIYKIFTEDKTIKFTHIRFGYPGKELFTERRRLKGKLDINMRDYDKNLLPAAIPPPPSSYVIKERSRECWDQPLHWSIDEVIIEPGAKLTICSNQFFSSDAKIIVMAEGRLVVDGGILTSACNTPWTGIEVQGNDNDNPLFSEQKWVEIINNGKIENSTMGIYKK
jgi:hypothetical protein